MKSITVSVFACALTSGFYIPKDVEYADQTFLEKKDASIIPSKFTGYHIHPNPEQKMSYFTEDIGLNLFSYYLHAIYPFRMGGDLFKDRRGCLFQHQQLLARYYMEGLSNDLGEIPEFEQIKSGYDLCLRYYNDFLFPLRDTCYDIDIVEDYERRIRGAIQSGFLYLDSVLEANSDSKFARFYGYLEMFTKMLFPPIDRVEQLSDLQHYSYEELNFEGVKIESIEIDKLVTFFDKFDSDITNVVDVEIFDETPLTPFQKFGSVAHYNGHDFVIKARQSRLNHLPFTFKLHVGSDKAQKAVVKVFIGPKFDEYGHAFTYEENRENFYELDHFFVDLVSGKNDIVRKSEDFSWFIKDHTTYFDLYKQIMLAFKGDVKFPLDMTEAHCGFPMRLMLPKGKRGGMLFQFFFMVIPYVPPSVEQFTEFDKTLTCGVGTGARYIDNLPFGYPFDRPIDEKNWLTPNMYYHDVKIFHKEEIDVNTTH